MSKKKDFPSSQNVRGFRDLRGDVLVKRQEALSILSKIFEKYGFEPLETSMIEYADALGKFLPDVDRPEGGVFGFKDEDEQWLALRYDLTAPLARFVAHNEQSLPKPYKRYQTGSVFRNEKPGPGRFREFRQFDADIIGTESILSEVELCIMMAESLEALGIAKNDYVININNRMFLTALLEKAGLSGDDESTIDKKGITLRAIDKLDRLGLEGVRLLLGAGRKDASGDFTKGAGLSEEQINLILSFTQSTGATTEETFSNLQALLGDNEIAQKALEEMKKIFELFAGTPYLSQIKFDPAVIRGLAYYTGAVFEAALTFDVLNDKGQVVQFGSVAGGGRYDDLIARFTSRTVPAVGMSIGVDRLLSALETRENVKKSVPKSPILVTIMDYDHLSEYMRLVNMFRHANIRAEIYLGTSGFKAQMKYADKRNCPLAIIQGSLERDKGTVILKDLWHYNDSQLGIIHDGADAQKEVLLTDVILEVKSMLESIYKRHGESYDYFAA